MGGSNCAFGSSSKFGANCSFGSNCSFGRSSTFGASCRFGSNNDLEQLLNLGRDLFLAATTILAMCASLVAGPISAAMINLGFTASAKSSAILGRTHSSTNQPSSVMVVTLGPWLYLLRILPLELGAILVINV